MMKKLVLFLILSSFLFSVTVEEIVKKSEQMMRGDTSYGQYEIIVINPRYERKIKLKSWALGTEKSFMVIEYPIKDKGVTFLKIDNDMWQYIPRIEKTIKLPPSMMMQSWMGTDLTNDDLVKESSMVDDYTVKLLSETEEYWEIEYIPHPDSAVVWGKIVQKINKDTFAPSIADFYDELGEPVRQMIYKEIKKIGDRYYPMYIEIVPLDDEGKKTILKTIDISFDKPNPKNVFTLQALRNYSR